MPTGLKVRLFTETGEALELLSSLLGGRGRSAMSQVPPNANLVAPAAAPVAASQTDRGRYRGSQCQLFEGLSEGGSIVRIAVAYCRYDLAEARVSDLRSLEQSVVE